MTAHFLAAAVFLVCIAFAIQSRSIFPQIGVLQWRKILLTTGVAAALLILAARLALYAATLGAPVYDDHTPSAVVTLMMHVGAGMPIYSEAGGGEYYSLPYGPACFLLPSFFLPFFDNPVTAARVSAAVLFFAGTALLAAVVARRYGAVFAWWAAATALAVHTHIIEPKETAGYFGIALAIFGGFYSRRLPFAVLAGLGGAIGLLSKIFVIPALAVLFPLLLRRRGGVFTAVAILAGAVFTAAVFLLHPSFSFSAYLDILLIFGRNDRSASDLQWRLFTTYAPPYFEIYGAGILAMVFCYWRSWAGMEIAEKQTAAATLALATTAFLAITWSVISSAGGGGNYLSFLHLPFIFWGMDWVARRDEKPTESRGKKKKAKKNNLSQIGNLRLLIGFAAAVLLVFVLPFDKIVRANNLFSDFGKIFARDDRQLAEQIRGEARRLSELLSEFNVEVGVTDAQNYHLYYWAKPEVYRNSGHTLYLPVMLMGASQKIKTGIAASIGAQKTDVFLLPKEGAIFSLPDFLPPYNKPPFPPSFVAAFEENYAPVAKNASPLYDIWAAKNRADEIAAAVAKKNGH